jgi:L-threonylcarbamoyladenylate synthase
MPAYNHVPKWLRGQSDKVAVRITAHPVASELCRRAGCAIVSTSANVSGQAPARSADAVRRMFGAEIDFVLDGPLGDSDRPTEIRDAITGKVVRPG